MPCLKDFLYLLLDCQNSSDLIFNSIYFTSYYYLSHARFKSSFLFFKSVLYKCISIADIRNQRMTIPTIMCNDATIFLPSVTGYASPYPTIVTVAIEP